MLDRHFADPTAGGYFITADDAADLIVRSKHCHDNAVPAGNGTLVGVFARLWVLTGDARWHDKARRAGRGLRRRARQQFLPADDPAQRLRDAAERRRAGDRRRSRRRRATEALRRAVYAKSLPDKIVRRLAPDTPLPANHPAAGKGLVDGKPALYVCRNMTCEAPITDPAQLSCNDRAGGKRFRQFPQAIRQIRNSIAGMAHARPVGKGVVGEGGGGGVRRTRVFYRNRRCCPGVGICRSSSRECRTGISHNIAQERQALFSTTDFLYTAKDELFSGSSFGMSRIASLLAVRQQTASVRICVERRAYTMDRSRAAVTPAKYGHRGSTAAPVETSRDFCNTMLSGIGKGCMAAALYLVTGGAGFIGSHLTTALLDAGCRVRILDNLTNPMPRSRTFAAS